MGVPAQPDHFVFPRQPGSDQPLPPDRISQAWRRLCQDVGVKARLHDLRHLQASLLLDAGEAVTVVAVRLGDRDTSTTLKVYGHLMPGADTRAAGGRQHRAHRRPIQATLRAGGRGRGPCRAPMTLCRRVRAMMMDREVSNHTT